MAFSSSQLEAGTNKKVVHFIMVLRTCRFIKTVRFVGLMSTRRCVTLRSRPLYQTLGSYHHVTLFPFLNITYVGTFHRYFHIGDPTNNGSPQNQSQPDNGLPAPKVSRKERLDSYVEELFKSRTTPSHTEWTDIGNKLREILLANDQWPSQLMKILTGHSNNHRPERAYQLGTSLLNYVRHFDSAGESTKSRTTVSLLISYMCICGNYHVLNGYKSVEMEDVIKELRDEIKQIAEVLDTGSSIDIIRALCSTNNHWDLSLPIIEDIKLIDRPQAQHYCPVVTAAFRNGRPELAWSLLEEMAGFFYKDSGHLIPDDQLYTSFLKGIPSGKTQSVDTLLDLMHRHRWIPSELVAQEFLSYYGREGWAGEIAKISDDGSCPVCQETLESETLTEPEFAELRNAFLEKCLRREDVFLNTSPQELRKFHAFLEKQNGFDIVLDGLNIGLQLSEGKGNRKPSTQLLKIAQKLTGQGRLLVCGRNHMRKWQNDMTKLENFATVFYADNMSSDDPFMIYAALHSGQNTKIVTVDMLRDHRHLLPPELRERFKTWQRTHQITFSFQKKLTLTWPTYFDTRVQRTAKSLHIPFEDNVERAAYEVPNAWICLTKGKC